MVERQNPLVGLRMDEPTAKYVGILESTLALHAIQDAKYRALLELITGDSWEDTKIDFDGKRILEIAEEALVKSGVRPMQAKSLVNKRWNALNLQTPLPPKAVKIEDVLPQHISPAQATVTKGTMADKLAAWKERNSRESTDAAT